MHYGENEGTFVLCCLELEFIFVWSLYMILTVMSLLKKALVCLRPRFHIALYTDS